MKRKIKPYDFYSIQERQKSDECKPAPSLLNQGKAKVHNLLTKHSLESKHGENYLQSNVIESIVNISNSKKIGVEESKTNLAKPKLKCRTDVACKTILRAFKKYYITNVKAYCDFAKPEHKDISSQEFLNKIDCFATEFLGDAKFGDVHIFIASIIDTKKKHSNLNDKYSKLKDQINSLVYAFNRKKIEALMAYPEFSFLLQHYLNQNDSV